MATKGVTLSRVDISSLSAPTTTDITILETVGPPVVMDDEDFEISAMAGKGFLSRERSFYLKSRPPSVVIIE